MKKITIIAILLLSALQSKAQNIVPVEKAIDYWTVNKGIPADTYLKDVNNLFAPYIGIWKGTINNKTYTFFITKITETGNSRSEDVLIIHHLIVDNMGSTLEDTRLSKTRPHMRGWHFSKDLTYYSLRYIGENSRCGRKGQIFVKRVNATTISLRLSPQPEPDMYNFTRCPGGKMAEQILPTETPVTLVKQ
nr:DUF6705 family protein [uncultured Flavobacterium sp.]